MVRGRGEGSLFKDSRGLWTGVVELPMRDGERRRKTIRSKDKATVIRRLADLRAELTRNHDLPTASETVEHWFAYWLAKVAPNQIRPKTLANYLSITRNWIIPVVGKVRLDKLSTAHIRRVTDEVVAVRPGRKPLSASTALLVHRILSSALEDAVREGRISTNPAKKVRPPRKAATKLEVLTLEEARRIKDLFDGNPEMYIWLTFLYTGGRRGEILGLQWDRVTEVIDLSWQLQTYTKGTFKPSADYEYQQLTPSRYLTRPKSTAGVRIVPVLPALRDWLAAWRIESEPNDDGLVFADAKGQPFDPDLISKTWPKVLEAVGIYKNVRLHDIRHTTVDLFYEAGMPEHMIVQFIGHSTRSQTQQYRSLSTLPQMMLEMAKFETLLNGTPR